MKSATIVTYGCQMNVNESAKMKSILEKIGYNIIDDIHKSDLVLLNTCTVREGAATQIYGKLGELMQIKNIRKTQGSDTIIGITGCFAQEMGEKLIEKFPVVDIVIGNQNIEALPEMLSKIAENHEKIKASSHDINIDNKIKNQGENKEKYTEKTRDNNNSDNKENNKKKEKSGEKKGEKLHFVSTGNEDWIPQDLEADFGDAEEASVAISYGCNNFCTYCIVPYVRGRERSVPEESILREVAKYVNAGYHKILLLGQNVNSYGHDLGSTHTFARLLRAICDIPGDFTVRFVSPHPRDFTDDVIDVIAECSKISKCIHVPLQSGSSRILKSMNRGYTKEQYLALVHKMKERIPNVALTTDIIVGFPGETEEDFVDTLDVVRESMFENAYMFMYSIRNGTKAATMGDQIDDNLKNERLQRLIELQNMCSRELSDSYMGKIVRVIVDGKSKKNPNMYTGRTDTNKIVLFESDDTMKGKPVNVMIDHCKTWTLYGKIV